MTTVTLEMIYEQYQASQALSATFHNNFESKNHKSVFWFAQILPPVNVNFIDKFYGSKKS